MRSSTALYVLLACTAVLAQGVGSELQTYTASLTRAADMTRAVAFAVSHNADDILHIVEQELADASVNGPAIWATTGDERRGRGAVLAYDGQGDLLWVTGSPVGRLALAPPPEVAARYAEGESGQLVLAVDSGDDAESLLTISQPLQGVPGGFVMATLLPTAFLEFFSTLDQAMGLTISLTDFSGRTLVGVNQDTIPSTAIATLAQQLTSAPTTDSESAGPTSSLPGRIVGHSATEHFSLRAIVTIEETEAMKEWLTWLPGRLGLVTSTILILALLGHRLSDQARRKAAVEGELRRREAEFRLLTETAADVVERLAADGTRLYVSPAIVRLLGHSPEELLGTNAFHAIHQDDRHLFISAAGRLKAGSSVEETVAVRVTHRDGHQLWIETSLRPSGDGTTVAISRDVTERKQLELKLANLARLDGLTGLVNRRAFDDAITQEVERSVRSRRPLALLMIDADHFKWFNDDYGHLAGDVCLKSIATVVAMAARRPGDLAARYGGEEMALLLPDTDLESACAIATNLCRQVAGLRIPHQRNLPWNLATVSIGVAAVNPALKHKSYSAEWLISAADLALYDAKATGRNHSNATPEERDVEVRLVS